MIKQFKCNLHMIFNPIRTKGDDRDEYIRVTGWSPDSNQDFVDVQYWFAFPYNQDYKCPEPCCCLFVGGQVHAVPVMSRHIYMYAIYVCI